MNYEFAFGRYRKSLGEATIRQMVVFDTEQRLLPIGSRYCERVRKDILRQIKKGKKLTRKPLRCLRCKGWNACEHRTTQNQT